MRYDLLVLGAMLALANAAAAHTRVDLRTQGKGVDVSNQSTKTSQTGGTVQETCSSGEPFILTTAAAGKSFYLCAGGVWTRVAGGVDLPVTAADHDKVLSRTERRRSGAP
jgi:hypothetical protein